MTNFVLVHGAWGGSHSYGDVPQMLEDAGHKVINCTLRGLGSRQDELHRGITLSDHVDDVCEQIGASGFERFVLAGHSYGGMVVTGVATRLGARIDALCYIDAFLPRDGNSLWDFISEDSRQRNIETQKFNPGLIPPRGDPTIDVVPGRLGFHPLLSLIEGVSFTGEEAKVPRRAYIFASGYQPTTFAQFADRLKDDPAWEYHEAETSHSVMAEAPHETVRVLLGLAS